MIYNDINSLVSDGSINVKRLMTDGANSLIVSNEQQRVEYTNDINRYLKDGSMYI